MKKDIVVFRKWGDHKDAYAQIIALFPFIPFDNDGNITSYMHVGQHSSADYQYVIKATSPASKQEYNGLFCELEGIGYNMSVRKSKPRKEPKS